MSESAVNLNEAKNALKQVGCKLKSQLDGSWAILEPKGVRVIVPDLAGVMDYCQEKSGAASPAAVKVDATRHPAKTVSVPLPETGVAKPANIPAQTTQTKPVEPAKVAVEPAKPALSAEQQKAIDAVNAMLERLRQQRLSRGLNFLHSELPDCLDEHGCPHPMKDKARSYAEAKLKKLCMDGNLHRVAFKNQEGQPDAMYFLPHFAAFLKG